MGGLRFVCVCKVKRTYVVSLPASAIPPPPPPPFAKPHTESAAGTSLFWKCGRWVFRHIPICSRAKRLLFFIISFTLISLSLSGFSISGFEFFDVWVGYRNWNWNWTQRLALQDLNRFFFVSFFPYLLSNGEFI